MPSWARSSEMQSPLLAHRLSRLLLGLLMRPLGRLCPLSRTRLLLELLTHLLGRLCPLSRTRLLLLGAFLCAPRGPGLLPLRPRLPAARVASGALGPRLRALGSPRRLLPPGA